MSILACWALVFGMGLSKKEWALEPGSWGSSTYPCLILTLTSPLARETSIFFFKSESLNVVNFHYYLSLTCSWSSIFYSPRGKPGYILEISWWLMGGEGSAGQMQKWTNFTSGQNVTGCLFILIKLNIFYSLIRKLLATCHYLLILKLLCKVNTTRS